MIPVFMELTVKAADTQAHTTVNAEKFWERGGTVCPDLDGGIETPRKASENLVSRRQLGKNSPGSGQRMCKGPEAKKSGAVTGRR